jgi:3-methyladenine DNA glycosylase AlkD
VRLRRTPPRGESKAVIAVALGIVDEGFWGRVTAYELVLHHPGGIEALTARAVVRLGRGLSDWASVDTYACSVARPAWREGVLSTRVVHRWLVSKDRWLRRTGVVCTVALNIRARGGRGDPARTLAVCAKVVDDRNDMVVKALSWALRSVVEWDRAAVVTFLSEHRDALATRVEREVMTKLRTGRKRR